MKLMGGGYEIDRAGGYENDQGHMKSMGGL